MDNLNWFHTLNKPAIAPPDWIFAPVWTILYILMAASLIILIKTNSNKSKLIPITLFTIQLALNAIWSPIFFGNMNITGGLVIVILLLLTLILTIISFFRISKIAAYLLIPYLIWTSFATILNYEYYRLN